VAATGASGRHQPRYEVADVVRAHGDAFVSTYGPCHEQRKVLRAIAHCRTAALGGHVEQCEGCGHQRIAYNSCRNRHCPKCQGKERAKWMDREQALLLPVDYFHVVFTLPHGLNPLLRINPRLLYNLLFHSAAATLREFALRHLGVQLAVTMVLHTWGQTLTEHAHVHCVVSAGGLSRNGQHWRCVPRKRGRRPFLFPVRALSRVFRGKYLDGLKRLRQRGELQFVGQSARLAEPVPWEQLLAELRSTDWAVYAKRPFAGPERVLKYLSRYTHRIAISNHRLLFVGDGVVRFRYKDYSNNEPNKEMTLRACEFLRRFLLHVLPRGFMRIRHYGLLANRHRQCKLERCRALLGIPPPTPPPLPDSEAPPNDTIDPTDGHSGCCPECGALMRVIELLAPLPHDTS